MWDKISPVIEYEEYAQFKDLMNLEELADLQEIIVLAGVLASQEELESVHSAKAVKHSIFKDKTFLERTE